MVTLTVVSGIYLIQVRRCLYVILFFVFQRRFVNDLVCLEERRTALSMGTDFVGWIVCFPGGALFHLHL